MSTKKPPQPGKLLILPLAGRRAACNRCGELCKVADTKDPDARLLRHAEKPVGQCINCAVTEFFYVVGLRGLIRDVKLLELLHIQQQFIAIMRTGKADANPSELDWSKIALHWDLPFICADGTKLTTPPASKASGLMEPLDVRSVMRKQRSRTP